VKSKLIFFGYNGISRPIGIKNKKTGVTRNLTVIPLPIPFLYILFLLLNTRVRFLGIYNFGLGFLKVFVRVINEEFIKSPKQFFANLLSTSFTVFPYESHEDCLVAAAPDVKLLSSPQAKIFGPIIDNLPNIQNHIMIDILFALSRPWSQSIKPNLQFVKDQKLTSVKRINVAGGSTFGVIEVSNCRLINLKHCIDSGGSLYQTTPYDLNNFKGLPLSGVSEIGQSHYFLERPLVSIKSPSTFAGYCHNNLNYWHFMTEIIPRVLRYSEMFDLPPTICDFNSHNNLIELVELISGKKSVPLDPQQNYLIDNLFIIQDYRIKELPDVFGTLSHNIFSSSAEILRNTAKKLIDLCDSVPIKYGLESWNERLFLSRPKDSTRKVVNQSQVETTLRNDFGFSILRAEKLPIVEQIRLFRSAKLLVAPAGAALANMMFCQPGTIVVVQPGTPNLSLRRFWHDLASLFSLKYYELSPPKLQNADKRIRFDIESLIKFMHSQKI
jgi:hypothetical protein